MSRVLLPLLILALLSGCGGDGQDAGTATAGGASAAVREVETGAAALLDVRTEEEHDVSRAANALHIPLAELRRGDRPDVAKDARLYVFCRTGRRAAEAVALLRHEGWTDVVNAGGLDDWERMGGEVQRG